MNLNARVSRMEAQQGSGSPPVAIVAKDDADYLRQFEDAFLNARRPGILLLSGTIAGVPFSDQIELLSHEDMLELLS